MNIRYFKFCDL